MWTVSGSEIEKREKERDRKGRKKGWGKQKGRRERSGGKKRKWKGGREK